MKILGVRELSGKIFYGEVKNNIISDRAVEIPEWQFISCMIEYLQNKGGCIEILKGDVKEFEIELKVIKL